MEKERTPRLVNGSVGKLLVKLTIPMIFGMMGMIAFNLIDTFFVGQLGAEELAALSYTFPVVMGIMSVSIGIGIGATAVVAKAIGEGDHAGVRRLTTDSLVLSVLIAIVFVIIGIITIDPLFNLLGASEKIIQLIKEYIVIWYIGIILVIVPMIGNSIIRATGDMKTPSYIMLFAVFINFILDPILIFGIGPIPMMGLKGAAIATLISRAITFVVALWILYYREKMITFAKVSFKKVWESWKSVLYIGLPTAGTRIVMPIGMGVVISLIASYGHESVAAFGVATRIEFFALAVPISLATVIGPFVGQNWAAKQYNRVKLGVKYSERFSVFWGFLMFAILAVIATPIASLFNDDPDVISAIVLYLWITPIGYGLIGVLQVGSSTLNVLHKPMHAAVLMIVQMFVLYIPLAYLGSYLYGLTGIFAAIAFTYVVAGVSSHFVLKRILIKETANFKTNIALLDKLQKRQSTL